MVIASLSISTTGLAPYPRSFVANGLGSYTTGFGSANYTNLRYGFIYSTLPISINAISANNQVTVPSAGQTIVSVAWPSIYAGGGDSMSESYSIKIPDLPANTTYYVRAYAYSGSTGYYKYGDQLSTTTLAGNAKGYYVSSDLVGFYDPLQVRDTSEGVDKVLTSDSSSLVEWKPVKSLFTFGHYIGEKYGGGIVAAVWKEGDDEKVLIVSEGAIPFITPSGISATGQWAYESATSSEIASSAAKSKYNGYLNTSAIVAQQIALGTTYSAAASAAAYKGGGFEDWYLPSYYELNQVFNNIAIVNKVLDREAIGNTHFWTSTEYSGTQSIVLQTAHGLPNFSSYVALAKNNSKVPVLAVRKESFYTGDGLIFNLDSTNIKSFSDVEYMNLGTASRWKDLVNGGMTSSYSFASSYYPAAASGGTTTALLAILTTIGVPSNVENLAYRQVGNWWIEKVSGTSTPLLLNNTGASSMKSTYFSVPADGNASLIFECFDSSTIKDVLKAQINIYVSIKTNAYEGPYMPIRELVDITTTSTRTIPLAAFLGKTISIKITAPNAYYISATDLGGPAIDNIQVSGTSGGYQTTGPVYFPEESGFIRFNGTGSLTSIANTFGSYFDVKVPVGNAAVVTVEMWMRMVPGYETRMPFGWGKYDIFTGAGGGLGFNTGNSDLFGLSSTQFRALGTIGNWAHYVFEMNSTLSYTNNKIYINGNEQTLSQVAGVELSGNRNFNGGLGRVGGWRSVDNNQFYLFRGDISVVRIYSRPLTKDEIMANYGKEKKRYDILPSLLKNNLFASIDFDDTTSFSGDGTLSREVVDISGNARNAMMTISQTTQVPAVIRTGSLYSGREIAFPGTIAANPVLEWADSVAIRSITSISVSFWIKISEHRTSEIIVKWDSTNSIIGPWEVFQSSQNSSSVIAFRIKSAGGQQLTFFGSKNIPLGEWTHVCATYDNSKKTVNTYINSSIDIASSVPQSFSIATGVVGQISVGRYVTAASLYYPLKGSIANIQIYDKSLSVGEIKNNYDAGKFKFEYSFADSNKYFSHEINGNPTFSISQNLVLDIGGSSNQKILKLNDLGYAKWVDKSSLFSRPNNYRYIGELYGGGIIVAMWYYPKTVFNYLIMSIEDVSAASQWSNVTSIAPTATSMHKGESNTSAIIAQASHTTSAAKLCDDYAGGGFTDWYLPSAFEMNHAFNAASIVDTVLGSDALVGVYWTSTEYSPQSGVSTSAYCYSFTESDMPYGNTGIQKIQAKSTSNKVRAFRLATNAVSVNNWDNTWEETYTPWWRRSFDPTLFWEADFLPARYEPVAFDYWDITTVTTGSIARTSDGAPAGGFGTKVYSITNSSVSTFERVIEFGVCWVASSPFSFLQDPTTSDSKVIGTGNYSSFNSTISWTTTFDPLSEGIYVRAYAITRSGTYYGARRLFSSGRS